MIIAFTALNWLYQEFDLDSPIILIRYLFRNPSSEIALKDLGLYAPVSTIDPVSQSW